MDAMNETYVTVSGNVTGDPTSRVTTSGVPFVTFRLASNVRRVDAKHGGYVDGGTNYVNVTAFRALGVNLGSSLKKGDPVIVYGRMRVNQWTSGERQGTSVDIDAYNAGFDMSRGTSTFTRVSHPQLRQVEDRMSDPAVQEAQRGYDEEPPPEEETGDAEEREAMRGRAS